MELYKPKEFEYDYLVEEFAAEYKLDVQRLKEIYNEYNKEPTELLKREWLHLWPEFSKMEIDIKDFNLNTFDTKTTEHVRGYYLQSPKDKATNPIEHYSLQEIMLAVLQDERNKNKKLMGAAFKSGDADSGKRFNAMQLALKVNMNSTYGASGNANFAHYDPDIAATITWCSRQCIGQLTEALECDYAYVDKEFLEDDYIKKQLAVIEKLDLVKIRKATAEELATMPRRRALRRLYTDSYEVDKTKEIYRIDKVRCEVVYQDTDSNYFECPAVQKYYLGCWAHDKSLSDEEHDKLFHASPDLIYQMMCTMVNLDNFLCQLTVKIIDRNPIGLGFEGSFIVCRFTNRKKKYDGVKAADDDGNVYGPDLMIYDEKHKKVKDLRAYDENGELILDYDKYWHPKETCLPMSDGTFVQLYNDKLIHERVNYLDYIQSFGVKVTGMDLTRRDQYKFINYYHVLILRHDLRICGRNKETGEWYGISLRTKISTVIEKVIRSFKKTYNQFIKIARFETADLPKADFQIEDFSKNAPNKDTKNECYHMIARYREEIDEIDKRIEEADDENEKTGLKAQRDRIEGYIPYVGSRIFYVVLGNADTEAHTLRGTQGTMQLIKLRVSLDELDDKIKCDMGMDEKWFDRQEKPEGLTYPVWLNAKKISMLYLKHYFSCLAKAIVLYQFGEQYPDIAASIDSGIYTDKEKNQIVTKYQGIMAKNIIDAYFPRAQAKKLGKLNVQKLISVKPTRTEIRMKDREISKLAGSLFVNYTVNTTNEKLAASVHKLIPRVRYSVIVWDSICRRLATNVLVDPRYEVGSVEAAYYSKIANAPDKFEAASLHLESCKEKLMKLSKLEKLLDI